MTRYRLVTVKAIQMNVKLIIAIGIMYAGFLVHFMLQEELLPKKGAGANDFHWPNALLFFYNVCSFLGGFIAMLITKVKAPKNVLPFAKVSIPQQIGMICSSYATKYVNYPTMQLMKSAKPVAVMLCQLLIFRKKVETKRILVVIILCLGLSIFGLSKKGDSGESSYMGIVLVCGALFCDAIYVPIVDTLKSQGSSFVVMCFSFMWSSVIIGIIRYKEIYEAALWFMGHQDMLIKLGLYCATGSIAAVALYAAIGLSDGLVVSIATTTRKFFTIIISAIYNKHNFSTQQWAGVGVVFVALGIEILFKSGKKHAKKE